MLLDPRTQEYLSCWMPRAAKPDHYKSSLPFFPADVIVTFRSLFPPSQMDRHEELSFDV